MPQMISITELTSHQGKISKRYTIEGDGSIKVNSAATIYSATAKTLEVSPEELAEYFDSLCSRHDTCITLGTPGEPGFESELVTSGSVESGANIARTKEFFSYPNSGATSICMLDFDTEDDSDQTRREFLADLDIILQDALIGEKGHERDTICKWIRPSSSGSCSLDGKVGTGLHVFIAVKGLSESLLTLIHRWCWLQGYSNKGFKITDAGSIRSESLIDSAVNGPERVVYTSDVLADGEGVDEFYEAVERKCSYTPGGVLDNEIACGILEALTVDYDREWSMFKSRIENTEEVQEVKEAWKRKQIQKRVENGMTQKEARASVKNLEQKVLLSNESLLRNDGTEIYIRDILTNPDDWLGVNKFCDPIKREQHRNVGKIMGTEESPILHSFSHGGVLYKLQWNYEDLLEWIRTTPDDELEDWFAIHTANSILTTTQVGKIAKILAKRLEVAATDVKTDIKDQVKDNKEKGTVTPTREPDEVPEISGPEPTTLLPEATHGDVIDDYLRRVGECRGYGEGLYVWNGGTIWKHHNTGVIQKQLRADYNHLSRCSRVSDYKSLARAIIDEEGIRVERWDEEYGFPCSDGFYKVSDGKVVRDSYSKELNCRFKMGLKPDFGMKTPYWDKVIENVDNPILFQQLFGLSLCGYLPKMQKAFIMFGEGGTGKGTTEDVLSSMLPKIRLTSMKLEQLNEPKYMIQLADARINFTSEVKRKVVDLTGAKQAIGGGLITGRALFSDPVSFYSNCGFIISCNHFFPLSSIGSDIERRFGHSIVRFTRRQDSQIEGLAEMIIEDELPGVLAWAMDGVEGYFEYGIDDELSLDLFQRWISNVDPVALFLEENIVRGRGAGIKRSDLWDRFKQFCEDGMYYKINKGQFLEEVEEILGTAKKYQGDMRYRNTAWIRD